MSEQDLIEAMEKGHPVIGMTELSGGIVYSRVLAVIKEWDEKAGKMVILAKLQSNKYDFCKPIVPADKIFSKES